MNSNGRIAELSDSQLMTVIVIMMICFLSLVLTVGINIFLFIKYLSKNKLNAIIFLTSGVVLLAIAMCIASSFIFFSDLILSKVIRFVF